jgi:cysteinyl-tRNA synthetase
MVREELGETIDIHLGGADLIFPHHENEIAQSESATGHPLARWWLHNGMVNVGGEKMSKSLGNFTTIRALLEGGVSPMTLRLFVLQAHYRKPLDFTAEALDAAAAGWRGLDAALTVGEALPHWRPSGAAGDLPADLAPFRDRFIAAMDDDLNTAAALGDLFELARPLRSLASRLRIGDSPAEADQELAPRWRLLRELAEVLGLQPEGKGSCGAPAPAAEEAIERLVEQRREAKERRDYASADRIREELRRQGIELVDKPGGVTVWLRR